MNETMWAVQTIQPIFTQKLHSKLPPSTQRQFMSRIATTLFRNSSQQNTPEDGCRLGYRAV
jgi:hypothetical protein